MATLILGVCLLAALAVIHLQQDRHQKAQERLLTRIQAPQLAPALHVEDTPDDGVPQYLTEVQEEREWAAQNGTDFMNEMAELNDPR